MNIGALTLLSSVGAWLGLSLCSGSAWSAPPWMQQKHVVAAGETLSDLALRYTGQRELWPQLQAHNQIADPRRLQPGQVIQIPADLLAPLPSHVRVLHVSGLVHVLLPQSSQPRVLRENLLLNEGTVISVGPHAYVRLGFPDGSVSALSEGTRIVIERVRNQPVTQVRQIDLRLERGRADSEVVPDKPRGSHFRIYTPLAVASVRGTHFGIEVSDNANVSSEVLEGRVEITPRASAHQAQEPLGTVLDSGQGTQLTRNQTQAAPHRLPAAPLSQAVPATYSDPHAIVVPLPELAGVSGYRVRIAQDPAMQQVMVNDVAHLATGTVVLPPLPDGAYTLGLRAIDALGLHGPEVTHPIQVNAYPVPPLQFEPEVQARLTSPRVTLRCSLPDPALRVRLQLARNPEFTHPVLDLPDMPDCRHQAVLAPGRYYWRLAAAMPGSSDPADHGPYSDVQSFEVLEATASRAEARSLEPPAYSLPASSPTP